MHSHYRWKVKQVWWWLPCIQLRYRDCCWISGIYEDQFRPVLFVIHYTTWSKICLSCGNRSYPIFAIDRYKSCLSFVVLKIRRVESWKFCFRLWELALALAYLVIINDSSIRSQSYIIKKYHSWTRTRLETIFLNSICIPSHQKQNVREGLQELGSWKNCLWILYQTFGHFVPDKTLDGNIYVKNFYFQSRSSISINIS